MSKKPNEQMTPIERAIYGSDYHRRIRTLIVGDHITTESSGDRGSSNSDMAAFIESLNSLMTSASGTAYTRDNGPQAHDTKAAARAEERNLRPSVECYFLDESEPVGWGDVVGNEAARLAIEEAVEAQSKHREIYAFYGIKPGSGVMLYGPPGCGKTMLGKAAAAALKRLHGAQIKNTILVINAAELQSPYVGVTEGRIRKIFAYSRAFKALYDIPLVVFIDEADAILPSRSDPSRRSAPWEQSNVATFLAEMDGMRDSGAFVVLATNRPEAIDPAILRDGRIDRKIKVVRPGYEETVKIATMHLAAAPLAELASADDAAKVIADEVFDPDRKIYRLRHSGGPSFFRFCNIINGAMVGGFVQRAKMHAFRRDIASGGKPIGITRSDLVKAVSDAFEEERRLDHSDALVEMIEDAGLSGCTVEELNDAISTPRGVAKH